jgi:hypothetical protein
MGRARFNPGWSVRREHRTRRGGCYGCRNCHRPIVHGDRCAECLATAMAQAIDRKRKRKRR